MDLIVWDDKLMSTGIELIDTQHKKLCKIVNTLGNAVDKDDENEVLYKIVEELIEYTKYHFLTEEELFDKFDFSEQDLHRSEHKYFVEYFKGIQQDLDVNTKKRKKATKEQIMDILKFLIDWFVTHITGSDREYVELFKKNGVV